MVCQKVPHRSAKAPSRFEKLPPDPDACVNLGQRQYDTISAIEGIASAMRPIDEAAGLAEALHLAWDKLTDILGEVEGQSVSYFFGSAK